MSGMLLESRSRASSGRFRSGTLDPGSTLSPDSITSLNAGDGSEGKAGPPAFSQTCPALTLETPACGGRGQAETLRASTGQAATRTVTFSATEALSRWQARAASQGSSNRCSRRSVDVADWADRSSRSSSGPASAGDTASGARQSSRHRRPSMPAGMFRPHLQQQGGLQLPLHPPAGGLGLATSLVQVRWLCACGAGRQACGLEHRRGCSRDLCAHGPEVKEGFGRVSAFVRVCTSVCV